jgi:small subunit ribosomal protein S8
MFTDPIADFLTRLRNGQMAGHKVVNAPASNLKEEIARILKDQGYILDYKIDGEGAKKVIKVALKYDRSTRMPAMTSLTRVSTPGLRTYAGVNEVPRVKNGLGVAIVSTSKGVMTDKQARQENVGGEVLCYVY